MDNNQHRFSITVDDELFQKIEDFRFENRFQNRNDAMIELIRRGLETLKGQVAD